MNKVSMLLLNSAKLRAQARASTARANLEVLLQNPAGIGEHSKLDEEIDYHLRIITESNDVVMLIDQMQFMDGD